MAGLRRRGYWRGGAGCVTGGTGMMSRSSLMPVSLPNASKVRFTVLVPVKPQAGSSTTRLAPHRQQEHEYQEHCCTYHDRPVSTQPCSWMTSGGTKERTADAFSLFSRYYGRSGCFSASANAIRSPD